MGKCTGCGDAGRGQRLLRLVRGASGISRSVIGIGLASSVVQRRRMEICQPCKEAVRCVPYAPQVCKCLQCGCFLKHKTRLAKERCPLGKW